MKLNSDRGIQEVFEYTLDNGVNICATKDHKFITIEGQMLPIDRVFQRGLELKEIDSLQYKLQPLAMKHFS